MRCLLTVRRIEYAYDGQGNAYRVTSYDAASSGSVVNQVQRAFNGLGQLVTEYQEHSGAVNTSTSSKVQYAYSEMPSGADQSRLTSITYTDGYVLTYNYSSGLNSDISRLSSLSDSTGSVEAYSYLGLSTVVVRAHSQPGVDLTFVGTPADAGDQYAGLDRFGRVVDQKWVNTGTSTVTDEFQYTYDAASNRTAVTNVVNSAFNESYTYDGLDQLASFARGSHTQAFDYDAVGNFDSVTTNGGTPQTRSANAQNEITGISGATTPTYDANGNMTGDETGRQFTYDSWNRLVAVKNSGGTTLETFAYDGLNRRVSQTASGTTTDLYYSADWQVLTEKVGSATTRRYVWSPVYVDALVLRDRDTNADGTLDERLWVQQDANWNVTALVDGSGNVVERYAYDPYGVQSVFNVSWSSIGSSAYSWSSGFQGTFYDSIAGLDIQRERWYSPTLGRWVTVDPLGFLAMNTNFYAAFANSPINFLDPAGLKEEKIPGDFGIFTFNHIANLTEAKQNKDIITYYGVHVEISYKPDAKSCPVCKNIRLIQVVRALDKDGKPAVFTGDLEKLNDMMTKENKEKKVGAGWVIDHDPKKWVGKEKKASIYYNDNFFSKKISMEGSNLGGKAAPVATVMSDMPGSGDKSFARMEFQTIAQCVDTGKLLDAIAWGFDIDWTGPNKGAKNLTVGLMANTLNTDFLAALNQFKTYYKQD